MAEIIRAKAVKEYESYEDWGADVDRQVAETLEASGWSEEHLRSMGPETVKLELAKLGHTIVNAE